MRLAQVIADQWAMYAVDRRWVDARSALIEGLKREQNGLLLNTIADLVSVVCAEAGADSQSVGHLIDAISDYGIDRRVMPTRETPVEDDDAR